MTQAAPYAVMKSRKTILLAAAAAVASVTGCGSLQIPGFDPRAESAPQRAAAAGLTPGQPLSLPEKLDSIADSKVAPKDKYRDDPLLRPIEEKGQRIKVELREAIQRAVVNNLDVRVASYTPAIEETRVIEAESRFDTTVTAEATWERNRGVSPGATGSAIQADFTRQNIEVGLQQLLDTGGQVVVKYGITHIDTDGADNSTIFSTGDASAYYQELSLQFTQPLLRDFGRDVNRARILINRNNQQVAVLEFRDRLEETLQTVERTYWQLVQAQRDLEIQQQLLENTISTADTLYKRIDVDVTRLQISQANASIETRRAQLKRARSRVADFSDDLKRLMSDGSLAVAGPAEISPATPPVLQQVVLDPQEQIETALLNRQELGQQQLRVDSALVALRVAKNNENPRLDLVGNASLQDANRSFGESFTDTFTVDFDGSWSGVLSLGLQFEYPIGNRAARSIFRRAQLQYLQANDSYRQIIEQVVVDVRKAVREVETTWTEIVRTRQAEFAAADALRAVQVREDSGDALTPEFVDLKLRQQELLAQSQRDHAAAISNYNIALSALERVKGTLLKYNNVVMDEAPLPRMK